MAPSTTGFRACRARSNGLSFRQSIGQGDSTSVVLINCIVNDLDPGADVATVGSRCVCTRLLWSRGVESGWSAGVASHELARGTDFFDAWLMVQRADPDVYSSATRARAFALWVGLFGCMNVDGVVTEPAEVLAERFEVSRASWVQYRKLLSDVGLIDQRRSRSGSRPIHITVHPPLL